MPRYIERCAAANIPRPIWGQPCGADVIHQVVIDPGRLSRQWFTELMATGLSTEQHVEIIGTLVALVSIDSFCRGIGVPLHPLPALHHSARRSTDEHMIGHRRAR